MRIVCISDTHGRHEQLRVLPCDLLVHAGDATRRGRFAELQATLEWMAAQPARHRIFIAGNHDACCEHAPGPTRRLAEQLGIEYLCDEGTTFEALTIWGSPITPRFRGMAFNRERGPEIAAHWAMIPEGLDLLITHGPPRGVGDRAIIGVSAGCDDLLARVRQVRPRVHVFGHIHEAAGAYRLPGSSTRFYNVASRRLLPLVREPVVLFA